MFDPAGTAFDVSGPPEAPWIVLIHGLGLDRHVTWAGMRPDLEARYRVLRYDLLGHGESRVPEGEVTLARLAEQLIALMDHVQIAQADLIGFSLGGMINRRVAMDHGSRVRSLVILNSPHERDAERQALVEAQARQSDAGGPAATLEAALARWITPGFAAANLQQIERISGIILANDAENYAKHRLVLATGVTELIRPDPPLAHPMLVMTCAEDSGSTPHMARAIAAETCGAKTVIVPDLKHMGLVERPDLFVGAILPFLVAQT